MGGGGPRLPSAGVADDPSFDLDAAGLRSDGAAVTGSVETLARKLEDALPAATTVQRRSRRMFSKEKVVEAIDVQLGTVRYSLTLDGQRTQTSRAQEVRGIVLKREPLALDAWLAAITGDLREQATANAEARDALERLLA